MADVHVGAKKASRAKKATGNAEVITMMKRAKGATLAEIMAATGWRRFRFQPGRRFCFCKPHCAASDVTNRAHHKPPTLSNPAHELAPRASFRLGKEATRGGRQI